MGNVASSATAYYSIQMISIAGAIPHGRITIKSRGCAVFFSVLSLVLLLLLPILLLILLPTMPLKNSLRNAQSDQPFLTISILSWSGVAA